MMKNVYKSTKSLIVLINIFSSIGLCGGFYNHYMSFSRLILYLIVNWMLCAAEIVLAMKIIRYEDMKLRKQCCKLRLSRLKIK